MTVTVIVFLMPAVVSVLLGWWVWRSAPVRFSAPLWRSRLAFCGLIAATFGLVLETAFMIRSYAYSYLASPSLPWLLSGWAAALTWVIAIVAAALGKGRVRWLLLLYAVTSFIGILLFVGRMD